MSLPGAIFVVFLVLKLTSVIDWSWWWITAPLWGILALATIVVLVAECSGIQLPKHGARRP